MQLSTLSLAALFVFCQSTAYSLQRRTSSLDKKCWKALQFRPFQCEDRLSSENISNCLINEGAKDELSRAAIILNPITFALSPSEKLPTFKEIFLSQTTLFTVTLLVQLFTGTQLTPPVGFLMMSDQDSFLKVLGASLPLLAGGYFLESVPLNITKNIKTGTELFSIRLLGRSTPRVIAAFKALVISAGAGLSEEIFFRGLLLPFLEHRTGSFPMGVLLSSVVFGVAHFPFIYGRGALLKALLGLYFAMVYMWSGYNLVVPVLVHAVYDFTTVFGAWYSAIKDLNKNLESTIKRLKIMPLLADEDEDLGLKDSCRKIFDIADVNKDGSLNKEELILSQQILRPKPTPYDSLVNKAATLLKRYDLDSDGRISFNEFVVLVKDDLKTQARGSE